MPDVYIALLHKGRVEITWRIKGNHVLTRLSKRKLKKHAVIWDHAFMGQCVMQKKKTYGTSMELITQ